MQKVKHGSALGMKIRGIVCVMWRKCLYRSRIFETEAVWWCNGRSGHLPNPRSWSEVEAKVSPSQLLFSLELRLPFEGLLLLDEKLELDPIVHSSESELAGWNSS